MSTPSEGSQAQETPLTVDEQTQIKLDAEIAQVAQSVSEARNDQDRQARLNTLAAIMGRSKRISPAESWATSGLVL